MDILIPPHTRASYANLDIDAIESSNIALMSAWALLKRESCPSCGTPYWIGHNTDNHIQFNIEESTCYACGAREQHDEEKKTKEHGVVSFPVLNMLLDKPRPTRKEWLEAKARSND